MTTTTTTYTTTSNTLAATPVAELVGNGQLYEALDRVRLLVREHPELPDLNFSLDLGNERQVGVQVPTDVGDETFRRQVVDQLVQVLGLGQAAVEGSFYCAYSPGWDVYTSLGDAA